MCAGYLFHWPKSNQQALKMPSAAWLGMAKAVSAVSLLLPSLSIPLVHGNAFSAVDNTAAELPKMADTAWIASDAVILDQQSSTLRDGRSLLHGCHFRRCAYRLQSNSHPPPGPSPGALRAPGEARARTAQFYTCALSSKLHVPNFKSLIRYHTGVHHGAYASGCLRGLRMQRRRR